MFEFHGWAVLRLLNVVLTRMRQRLFSRHWTLPAVTCRSPNGRTPANDLTIIVVHGLLLDGPLSPRSPVSCRRRTAPRWSLRIYCCAEMGGRFRHGRGKASPGAVRGVVYARGNRAGYCRYPTASRAQFRENLHRLRTPSRD